jgi:triacylglycerol lipase
MSFLVELPKDEYNSNAFAGFNPAGGFASGNALAMAWMAQLAYETRLPDKVGAISQLFQLTDLQIVQQSVDNNPLPLSDTRGIVASRGEAIIVAFAGTDPLHLLNWVSDFYIGRPTEDVHEGFQAAADAVWPVVGVAIERSINENRRLFVVGHSLGAAIALVTVDRARQEKNLSSAQVFVFGAPRVGKADFVAAYNPVFGRTTYRLVYGRDIVPTVPPVELGFHHVGRFLPCSSGTKKFNLAELSAEPTSDEPSGGNNLFRGAGDQLLNLFGGRSPTSRVDALGRLTVLLAPSIGDHLPDRYIAALTP